MSVCVGAASRQNSARVVASCPLTPLLFKSRQFPPTCVFPLLYALQLRSNFLSEDVRCIVNRKGCPLCVAVDRLHSAPPVYKLLWRWVHLCFSAEKVSSLGKDWHRPCLRCEKCNKTLSSGSHAEVRPFRPHAMTCSAAVWLSCTRTCTMLSFQRDGKPYCHKPCYAALFGPGGKRSIEHNSALSIELPTHAHVSLLFSGYGHGGTESHKYWKTRIVDRLNW